MSLWLHLCWKFVLQNVGGSEWVQFQKRLSAWWPRIGMGYMNLVTAISSLTRVPVTLTGQSTYTFFNVCVFSSCGPDSYLIQASYSLRIQHLVYLICFSDQLQHLCHTSGMLGAQLFQSFVQLGCSWSSFQLVLQALGKK